MIDYMQNEDEHYMQHALKEAKNAFDVDEVPIGAVVVFKQNIIARAHNNTENLNDVTAHAEMQAITAAANHIGAKYLDKCALYTTVEPCVMCAGALYWSRIQKLIFGAFDPQKGYSLSGVQLHPKTKVQHGILAYQSKMLMQTFFANKRKR